MFITLGSTTIYSWDNCPFGLENDPCPGECKRYIDTDNDGICDFSQPAPENREIIIAPDSTATNNTSNQEKHEEEYSVEIPGNELKALKISDIAELWEIRADFLLNEIIKEFNLKLSYNISNTIDELRKEHKFSPTQIKDIAESIKFLNNNLSNLSSFIPKISSDADAAQLNKTKSSDSLPAVKKRSLPDYNLLEIFFITFLIYFSGKFLARRLKISVPQEKKFWNFLLLISFIVSAGTGIILVLIRDFEWFKSIKFNFLFWHVEFSIVMALLGIFHALWHLKYYISIFYKPNKKR